MLKNMIYKDFLIFHSYNIDDLGYAIIYQVDKEFDNKYYSNLFNKLEYNILNDAETTMNNDFQYKLYHYHKHGRHAYIHAWIDTTTHQMHVIDIIPYKKRLRR